MKNIVLIGMSGTGKTTIGMELSKILKLDFIDTDMLIEERLGISIEKIFNKYGEKYFRTIESKIVAEIGNREGLIISTGGGIILNKSNIIKLKEKGIVILLESSIDNIVNNLKKSNIIRPLISNENDIYKAVEKMYKTRKELYHLYADYIVKVDNRSLNNIIYEILQIYDIINSWGNYCILI